MRALLPSGRPVFRAVAGTDRLPEGGTAMFALLAMAGDLGGSMGPGIVGRVTQRAGDDIQAGMGVGLIFPLVLLLALFLINRKNGQKE